MVWPGAHPAADGIGFLMHMPDLHASEAILGAVIAGLTTLVGVQLRVILGMVKQTRLAADEQQGRLHELGERLDRVQERRQADAARNRARLEEIIAVNHRVLGALGDGEAGT